jgi:hypothetical protein
MMVAASLIFSSSLLPDGLAQALDQGALLGLGGGGHADVFISLLSLLESGFLPNLGGAGNKIVEAGHGCGS